MIRDSLVVLFCAWTWAVLGSAGASAQQLTTPPKLELPTGPAAPVVSRFDRADVSVNNSIVRQHESGAWSVLGITAVNAQDTEKEGLVAVFMPQDPARQFARRVWVPPGARRYTFLPFQVPPNLDENHTRQTITAISLDPNATTRETFQRREGDPLVPDLLVSISHDPVKSAALFRRPPTGEERPPGPEIDLDAWDVLMAARELASLPKVANELPTEFLPPWSEVLEGFDQFLITNDRITHDAAGLAALREWVRDGGRLWLMLDRMSPDTVRALLGNAMNFSVVDRMQLDQYTLDSLDSFGQMSVHEACDFETPVEFVRIVTSARDVPCRVNGWPAAVWIPLGEGEVLVTTLAPRGWRPGEGQAPTNALRTVAVRVLGGRNEKVDMKKQFQAALQQRIGYRIPGRFFAASVLGGYCLALLAGGVFFYRRQQAERLMWLAPAATLVAAGILAAAGGMNSRSIPPTIAFTQLVTISPESDELFVHGLAATYDQRNRPVQWRGDERGWAVPEVLDGTEVRRQVWTSNDSTETQNVSTRPGSVGLTRLDEVRPLPEHFAVRAWFGPNGLMGEVSGNHARLIDPVLVAQASPSLAVALRPDGSFASTPDDVLAANQFSAGSLLSDEQRRRQDVFRQLFNPADTLAFPRSTSLAAWSAPFDTGLRMPEDFRLDGEALVLLPVVLERTPPGGEFRIPATFLRAMSALGGQGQSLAYNSKTGQWMPKLTAASDTNLNFQLPAEVLPCDLTKGTLSVRLNAPSREFQVWTFRDGVRELFKTVPDPNGVYDFELASEDLSVDEAGRVKIGLAIGITDEQRAAAAAPLEPGKRPPPAQFNNSTWQIEYVRLTVDGRARQEDAKP